MAEKSKERYSISIPKLSLKNTSYIPLLMALLLVASFFLGRLSSQVEYLKKGTSGTTGTTVGQTAPTPPGQLAPGTKVDVANGHLPVKGNENAKVTIVDFSDFECPFCGKFYKETYPQLKKDYIDTGKVKMYLRHYPLSFHPRAIPLAMASECANDQDAFWKMHDKIFDNTNTIASSTDENIKQWAGEIGLDLTTFNSCFDSKKHQAKIDEDFAAGGAAGVSGTPTFYINGTQIVGAQPFAAFKTIIDQELAK